MLAFAYANVILFAFGLILWQLRFLVLHQLAMPPMLEGGLRRQILPNLYGDTSFGGTS